MTKTVNEHWDDPNVESQYDKHLMNLEIRRIKLQIGWLPAGSSILDVGCGEGEGTAAYASQANTVVGIDRSSTRLALARERLKSISHVQLVEGSATMLPFQEKSFDVVISQRCMINLLDDVDRYNAAQEMARVVKVGGKVILLEGSVEGHDWLNKARNVYSLPPIDVKWHNRFFTNGEMLSLFKDKLELDRIDTGLSGYLYLTRVIKPALAPHVPWDCMFNMEAANDPFAREVGSCPRLQIWVFERSR